MNASIIDRRKNPKGKSLDNRQRFMRRYRDKVREGVREKIRESNVPDIASPAPKRVRVSETGIHEPVFRHGKSGVVDRVYPGNRDFVVGDRIRRKHGGEGGFGGSPDGELEDDFVFEISQAEFLDYFFDGLELPDMVKHALADEESFRWHRSGYAREGSPGNLDIVRTMRHSQARRAAFRVPKLRRKRELEEEKRALEEQIKSNTAPDNARERIEEIDEKIEVIKRRLKVIPFLDNIDVRYRRHEKVPEPIEQAVMFCLMDVSGSMGQKEKEIAKRFFMLLYLFLTRNYKRVEVVFIRHHHKAEEVDEEEFFTSRESGGTVVSTALELMCDIIGDRYPVSTWNVYGSHVTDGDNWAEDVPIALAYMSEIIMTLVQYFAYVEVVDPDRLRGRESGLWTAYRDVAQEHPQRFAMTSISETSGIYSVFRKLFEADFGGR